MPEAIIPITEKDFGNDLIQTCNARDLHAFLEVKSRFNDWITTRIDDFGFKENHDYVTFTKNSVKGRPTIEYFLSISMAKELAMVERNAKGKEARLYFIECERIAKTKTPAPALPSYSEALRQLADAIDRNGKLESQKLELENQAIENAPKVSFAEDVVASGKEVTSTAAAKILGIAPQKFRDWLRKNGFLYAQANQAMQTSIKKGLMVVRFSSFQRSDGTTETASTPHITGAGLFYFYQRLLDEGLIDRNQNLELTA